MVFLQSSIVAKSFVWQHADKTFVPVMQMDGVGEPNWLGRCVYGGIFGRLIGNPHIPEYSTAFVA